MSILVTNGCSLSGSKFINDFFFKNPDTILVNIDNNSDDKNVDENIRYSMRYHFIKGDLSSYDLIFNLLNIFNIRNIAHFVGQCENNDNDLIKYTHANVLGTHTLLEACRKYGKIKKFVHFLHKDESENCNVYCATQESAELLCKSYCVSFNMPIIIEREP
jgi:dTDP-D-glucose 4,6-dehydratase